MEPQHLESLYPEDCRVEEIGKLLSFVKEGKSAQLIALPGVGRGNTLGFLAYNRSVRIHHVGEENQKKYHFVVTNFSEIVNRPPLDVTKFIFLELVTSLHERRREEEFLLVYKLFKEALSYQDELVLFQALKDAVELLTLEKGLTIIFLIDRFEAFIPQVTRSFFTNLRSLRGRAKYQFAVIFGTTRPLEDVLEPDILADFYEFVADNHVYLSLEDKPGLTFRREYLEKLTQKNIGNTTYDSVLQLTAGHGKLTRLSLEAILGKNMEEKIIDQAFLLEQKTIQGALNEIWHFLTPDEQQDMQVLCKNETCPLPSDFLKKIGLLQNGKIAIPLFMTFVQRLASKLPTKDQFAFDAETNTILRSNIVISNQLTQSEFRLLRLLLEKKNILIDREEVIAAVWSDSKTQAGVSEQALDQLIFRLRKKIENDPAHPTHVQTIKGRGVQFVE